MLNILVVEDDSAVATELIECLEHMGHRAEWSAAQGPVLIAPGCDLVLLDLSLGKIDGFQVLNQLAVGPSCPPIAIMSGRDGRFMQSARDLARSRGLRTVAMLSKPFSPRELAAVIDEISAPALDSAPEPAVMLADPYYVFQYKNNLLTGVPVGCEVLVRLPGITDIEGWFMGLRLDQAHMMTVAAANAAIDLHRRLAAQGRLLPVAFNCPSDVFSGSDFLESLRRACGNADVSPAYIGIELTEQKGTGTAIDVASMACRYALAGFPVLLDDFGTGTASLDHLLRLPLSEVKIDRKVFRSLVRDGRALLHEIAAFCRANGIISTVEGIETDDDMKVAQEAGADYGQGFLWSRPSPIADLPGAQ
jgi:EAL domain-containing protein (putative c-di-GMP-specific phosphodiesterase class I)